MKCLIDGQNQNLLSIWNIVSYIGAKNGMCRGINIGMYVTFIAKLHFIFFGGQDMQNILPIIIYFSIIFSLAHIKEMNNCLSSKIAAVDVEKLQI